MRTSEIIVQMLFVDRANFKIFPTGIIHIHTFSSVRYTAATQYTGCVQGVAKKYPVSIFAFFLAIAWNFKARF